MMEIRANFGSASRRCIPYHDILYIGPRSDGI